MDRLDDKFAVLLAGDLTVTQRVRGQLDGARVIAADGGIMHALELGLVPELWIGDFDSSDSDMQRRFGDVTRQTHPPAKDVTDGELAVDAAVERGARSLVLAGALGGRSDHHLQHVMHLVKLAEDGLDVMMTSGYEEAHPLIAGQLQIELPAGAVFSVIALSDLSGLSLRNVDWPLRERDVAFGSSLTISNVALGPVDIDLASGRAVVVASFR